VKAVALYQRACSLGSIAGCVSLASLYENGKGVTKDRARAKSLYEKACNDGDALACNGMMRTAK
jgi:TPR repeat protein